MPVENKAVAALRALATAVVVATAAPHGVVVSVTTSDESGSGQRHWLRLSVTTSETWSLPTVIREAANR